MKEIDAAIEALEAALSDDQPYLDRCKAALAGLRSLTAKQGEQEAVAWHRWYIEDGERGQEFSAYPRNGFYPLYASPTCKQDLQVPTVKERLTVQCWVTNSGQFSFEPQDERYWTRMVRHAPEAKQESAALRDFAEYIRRTGDTRLASMAIAALNHTPLVNAQLLEALKQLVIATKHLNPCPGTLEMAEKAIAAVEKEMKS